ncbi:hypothetical protein FB99_40960 (plasmid) [Pantoea agglomerans]|nr:hypothetical protein FB99_40960 [Pantoea agglomerans]
MFGCSSQIVKRTTCRRKRCCQISKGQFYLSSKIGLRGAIGSDAFLTQDKQQIA